LKASSYKDTKRILDQMVVEKTDVVPTTNAQTAIVKLRLLIMWILESTQRIDAFIEFSPDLKLDYDVDTHWNSTFKMVTLGIRLRKPLVEIVVATPTLTALIITKEEWLYLREIHEVLEPF
jgi:hypothetical protein